MSQIPEPIQQRDGHPQHGRGRGQAGKGPGSLPAASLQRPEGQLSQGRVDEHHEERHAVHARVIRDLDHRQPLILRIAQEGPGQT